MANRRHSPRRPSPPRPPSSQEVKDKVKERNVKAGAYDRKKMEVRMTCLEMMERMIMGVI